MLIDFVYLSISGFREMSGEMFIFTYQLVQPPCLIYRVISKDGVVGKPVRISMSGSVMMHDFAISENYAIFMDLPLLCNPLVLEKHNPLFNIFFTLASPFCKRMRPCSIGIITTKLHQN